jgi:hypothetical protein
MRALVSSLTRKNKLQQQFDKADKYFLVVICYKEIPQRKYRIKNDEIKNSLW